MTLAASLLALITAGAPVELVVAPSCRELDVAEVRRVLAVELRPNGHGSDTRFVTRVQIDCDGDLVRLSVDDPVSRKSLQRSIDLSTVAEKARARTLGLAAAELVAVSWTELITHPTPAVEPAAPAPPVQTRDEAIEAARERSELRARSRLLLEGTFAFPVKAPLLFGAGLRWSIERFDVLGLELDVRVEHGQTAFPQGDVSVNRATLGFGVHARAAVGLTTWRALVMLRGGAVELSGSPAPGSGAVGGSGFGPWFGLALGGAASVQLGPMSLELGIEGGVPLAGVVGTVFGIGAVHLDTVWFGAHVGFGVLP